MMDVILSSETPVLTRATQRNIPEDDILQLYPHCLCKDLRQNVSLDNCNVVITIWRAEDMDKRNRNNHEIRGLGVQNTEEME
jgi:hypothetical protein